MGQTPISHCLLSDPSMELQVGQYLPWSCEWVTVILYTCIILGSVLSLYHNSNKSVAWPFTYHKANKSTTPQ